MRCLGLFLSPQVQGSHELFLELVFFFLEGLLLLLLVALERLLYFLLKLFILILSVRHRHEIDQLQPLGRIFVQHHVYHIAAFCGYWLVSRELYFVFFYRTY